MTISIRPATWSEVEEGLLIQPRNRGDDLVGNDAAMRVWRSLYRQPFFCCVTVEASSPIHGHHQIGFGAAVFLSRAFAESELFDPQPNINARLIASLHLGKKVLASTREVAQANAGEGIDVLILCPSCWRDSILDDAQRKEVQGILPTSFAAWLAGHRIRTILAETSDEVSRAHLSYSLVFATVAEYRDVNRTIYAMTEKSVSVVSAHLGNNIFAYREPLLRLKASHQQLLRGALAGGTDLELAASLGITFAAVKARWRSVFDHLEATMPDAPKGVRKTDGRGPQKRHQVLAYVRTRPEELQPFEWKS